MSTRPAHTRAKPASRDEVISSWYTAHPSRKLIEGMTYCIGPSRVNGTRCADQANSMRGTTVTMPVPATISASRVPAVATTLPSLPVSAMTVTIAGTRAMNDSADMLSIGLSGTCRLRMP